MSVEITHIPDETVEEPREETAASAAEIPDPIHRTLHRDEFKKLQRAARTMNGAGVAVVTVCTHCGTMMTLEYNGMGQTALLCQCSVWSVR